MPSTVGGFCGQCTPYSPTQAGWRNSAYNGWYGLETACVQSSCTIYWEADVLVSWGFPVRCWGTLWGVKRSRILLTSFCVKKVMILQWRCFLWILVTPSICLTELRCCKRLGIGVYPSLSEGSSVTGLLLCYITMIHHFCRLEGFNRATLSVHSFLLSLSIRWSKLLLSNAI